MGCVFGKPVKEETTEPPKKSFSWESRRKVDPNDYLIESVERKEVIRPPGSVNGQQFLIQGCRDATICIFDHINTVSVDDCENCTVVLAAVRASVYLRNCIGTTCITSCGQFRSRDCRKCLVFIHCATQPIIETSTAMKFGTFQLSYNVLPDHLREAGLNLSINSWTEVYDFTPVQSESNWHFVNMETLKFCLKTRSKNVDSAMKDLGVTWMGKSPISVVRESTV